MRFSTIALLVAIGCAAGSLAIAVIAIVVGPPYLLAYLAVTLPCTFINAMQYVETRNDPW